MSWSVNIQGKAGSIREKAARQFAQAAVSYKRIPVEKKSIEGFAATVDALCEAAPDQAVKINAHGSAWHDTAPDRFRSFTFKGEIELIDLT